MTDRDSITRTRPRAPGAEGDPPSRAVHHHGRRPGSVRDNRLDAEVHEGRRQTGRQQAYAGSRLKPLTSGKAPPVTGQPSSRTGENPPYGMSGGIEETSASFEARSAPRSYPTARAQDRREPATGRFAQDRQQPHLGAVLALGDQDAVA